MDSDIYRTILEPSSEVLFKVKNSKFFGYAFPLQDKDEVKVYLESLKKKHYSARHYCYAYKLGTANMIFRANDDGEPNNSAGIPIYRQIQSFKVTNILIVVVRYFGGIKLGIGGLINAYGNTAQKALQESNIIQRTINMEYLIKFDYKNMDKVMRIIKERNLTIVSQKLELDCELQISVRKKESEYVFGIFNDLFNVSIKLL